MKEELQALMQSPPDINERMFALLDFLHSIPHGDAVITDIQINHEVIDLSSWGSPVKQYTKTGRWELSIKMWVRE